MNGILNLLKPAGMTSHDGVSLLRRMTGIKRIGHTGTLDPMAVGVLPICIGNATRVMEYLDWDDKRYRCEMCLGVDTDTQDLWGTVLETKSFSHVDEALLLKTMAQFRGPIVQEVPAYSAVKIDGKKMYEYAREGTYVPAKIRPVHIKSLELVRYRQDDGRALFDVECSKGTYVRTICKDIGEALSCKAAMSFLVRTASGIFRLENTVTIEELLALREGTDVPDPQTGRTNFAKIPEESLKPYLLPPDAPLVYFGRAVVGENRAKWFLHGGYLEEKDLISIEKPNWDGIPSSIREKAPQEERYKIYFENQSARPLFLGVAVYHKQKRQFLADKIFVQLTQDQQIPRME